MIRASVAMVTYNGEKYIREQIESVLSAMGEQDELVISDDGSGDCTAKIIREYEEADGRIRVLKGPRQGVKRNVDSALRACRGEYIFLADQDDIWKKEKIDTVMDAFAKRGCAVVVHDAVIVGEDGKEVLGDSFYKVKNAGAGALKNIYRNTYMGCCMAFHREILPYVLPIPQDIEMHDQWIGVINDLRKLGTCFLPDALLYYRRHGDNVSAMKHYGIGKMIANRAALVRALWRRKRDWKGEIQY